ncbi:MAG: hypothetical protein JXM70_21600 [Pirellulales bacterium]|nr:hypothetical protein [Pirellulales bacterium]
MLSAKKTICIERPKYLTEFFRESGFDESKPVLRQAEALCYVLDHLSPTLFDDELIVGSTTSHRLGTPVYPEFMSHVLWPELPIISRRKFDPVAISDDEADVLANEVFPFWKDRNIFEYTRRKHNTPRSQKLSERLAFYILTKANGITHIIPDYQKVVSRGLLSLIEETREQEEKAQDAEAAEFYRAARVSFQGLIRFAERYSFACEQRADISQPERAAELKELAAILRQVPARPASTFHEALQSIWITQVALHQENSNMALSFGRFDQILYPYYASDSAVGIIDEKRIAELIGCFFIKMGDHMPIAPAMVHEIISGASTNQAITLGGMKADGSDGTNDLTYIMLGTATMLAMREPNVCARLHQRSPEKYRRSLLESIYRSGAIPALYNDEQIVQALTEYGIPPVDARDYGIVGCVETTVAGKTMGHTGAIVFNLAAVLELALNDGVYPFSKEQIGPKTGSFDKFASYEDFCDAFNKQLQYMVDLAVDGNTRLAEAHAELHPTPLLSGLIDGTMKSGRDVTRGGAKYNSSGVAIVGLADVADSLSALNNIVFEQETISKKELLQALAADFSGHKKTLALLTRKSPKYGTDDTKADEVAAGLVELVASAFARHKNPRGGEYHLGFWSVTFHASMGGMTGALPNGKRSRAPLASGATPVSGAARRGPTASFSSSQKLPARQIPNCIANNHKIPRSLLGRPGELDVFDSLVEGYIKGGGMQVQFTIQDKKDLLAARDNPQEYKDLLVRVSGYTAYFSDLNRKMQDEIIARTEDVI